MFPAKAIRLSVTGLGLALLAGCGGGDHKETAFYREAGALVDTGSFGNATMQNHQYMTGEARMVYDLSQRFAEEVRSTVTFAFNSSALEPQAREVLREQAQWIRQFPEIRFRVYGHTDKVGSASYNKALGLRRAHAVVNYLVSQGISRSRLEAVVSFGETQPLIVTEGNERQNRRTVTEVSGFVKGHPTLMDGRYGEVIYREYVNSAQPTSTLSGVSVGEAASGSGG